MKKQLLRFHLHVLFFAKHRRLMRKSKIDMKFRKCTFFSHRKCFVENNRKFNLHI